jgi:hypothetical protein
MFVFFPCMHAALLPRDLPAGALLLDPGYLDEPGPEAFRPEALPLDPATARNLVRDSLNFGEQFRAPGDLAAFGLQEALAENRETASAIQAELTRRVSGAMAKDVDPAPAQAQLALLLAWFYEERFLEMAGLEQGLADSWQRFGQSLGLAPDEGLESEELDRAVSGLSAPLLGRPDYSFGVLLEAAATLLPAGAVLLTAEAELAAGWRESGLSPVPAAEAGIPGLPEGCLVFRAPVWRLSGRRKAPDKRPALLREIAVAALPAGV